MSLNPQQFTAFERLEKGTHSSREVTITDRFDPVVMGVVTYNPPREQMRAKETLGRDPFAGRRASSAPAGHTPGQTMLSTPRSGGLDNLFVHPEYQRRGVGTALINAAQEIHQQRFGRQSIAGPDPMTSLSKDTKAVMGSLGVSHLGERNSEWTLDKSSRDEEAEDTVTDLQDEMSADPASLGSPVQVTSSLQTKMQVAGLAPGSQPQSDGSKQLSMLSKKRSSAPQIKKRLQQ